MNTQENKKKKGEYKWDLAKLRTLAKAINRAEEKERKHFNKKEVDFKCAPSINQN